jgi:hypothetical protein
MRKIKDWLFKHFSDILYNLIELYLTSIILYSLYSLVISERLFSAGKYSLAIVLSLSISFIIFFLKGRNNK